MLQTLTNTRPYAQPLSPIEAKGERYSLPPDFVDGLAFLSPFVQRRGAMIELWVHVLGGKLYVITNNLVIDYEIGDTELPNVGIGSDAISALKAFGTPPVDVGYELNTLQFQWTDGQELVVHCAHTVMNARPTYPSSELNEQMANDAFERFMHFNDRITVSDDTRKELRRMHNGGKLSNDIYMDGRFVISRMSSNGRTWTSETATPFECNADRVMRFDRKAFLAMIKVAQEINFATSPVCFRHEHGRGMLIERTLGADVPDFEEAA